MTLSADSRTSALVKPLLVVLAAVAACGPKPAPAPIPTLPGDGDTNVAKPPAAPSKPAVDDPWTGRADLIAPPATKPPTKVELPAIEQWKLGNGLQVFAIKNDHLPVVSIQMAIRAGRVHEPRARLGVSDATADMIVKGTKKRDATALAKAIDFVGGTIGAQATYEATLIQCSVLARNANICFELLPEMIQQSTFPDDELAKVKQQMIGEVRAKLDSAPDLASQHVQNLLWTNEHVRGWINNEGTVSALRRDDLVAWRDTWYVPNNTVLVVAGDIDTKKLRGDLDRAFGGWKKGVVPPTPSYPEQGLSGIRIRLVDKPGQTQTHIRIAQFGIKHDDPRFFDTLVWNYALGGGGFSSRLMKTVRVEGGKTYGASSSFDRNLDKGSFVASTFTRNSEAIATAKLILDEIKRMAKEGPTDAEVSAAIANIAGTYSMRFQSAEEVGGTLLAAELHGFGIEYLTNFPIQVGKVDVAAAKQAAGEILDPKNYVIVLVGDAKDLEPQLKKADWRYEKMSFSEPITPEIKQAAAPPDPKAVAAAKKIVDEALATKGGKAKLAAIKATHMVGSGTTAIQGQNVPVEIERSLIAPDKLKIDATLAKQVQITVCLDGKGGWQRGPNPKTGKIEVVDMDGDNFAAIDFERWRDPDLILLKAVDPAAKLAPAPDETIDGKPHAVVKVSSPFPSLDVSLYIDKKTKLVTRMSFTDIGPNGQRSSETDDFSEYRDVGGVKVAFKRNSTTEGRVTTLEYSKIELDAKIDPAIYKKP